ncbi:amidase family protein [Planosporangium sp. 12N6]|uniref:amidase family protein n=1 Tax=Planosporangium spinosum TaxID=3402278 RepID=UPI003CE922EF
MTRTPETALLDYAMGAEIGGAAGADPRGSTGAELSGGAEQDQRGAAGAGPRRPAPAPRPPELLALPLRERVRLVEAGEVAAADWARQADEWSRRADTRYRACVELRAAEPGAPPVRVGVKDTVDVAGFATRLGLRRYRHYPQWSAAPLRAVRGAWVNAKVVTTELNIGLGSGCVNPYFPDISPAGSSTGSGVSVAAGICDLSLGTDVLGSVRWPAGRCGVVGLRLTHDERQLSGVFPLSPAMDAPGWVARTADDLAFGFQRLGLGAGGPLGTASPFALDEPPGRRRLRVGIVREVGDDDVDPEILAALDRTRAALAGYGHPSVPVGLGELWRCRGAAWELCSRDAWHGYRVWRRWITDDLLESTRLALEAGARVSDGRHAEIRAAMARERARVADLFTAQGVDVWLLPLDPDVPRPAGAPVAAASTIPDPDDPGYDREAGYTPLASFTGLPAITFPVGRTRDGTAPLAVQAIAPPYREDVLLRLARDVAHAVGDLGFAPR